MPPEGISAYMDFAGTDRKVSFPMGNVSSSKRPVFPEHTGVKRFRRLLELPSGGDTSYPGFLLKDHTLWVSYYSSHQGKTAIYLAGFPFPF